MELLGFPVVFDEKMDTDELKITFKCYSAEFEKCAKCPADYKMRCTMWGLIKIGFDRFQNDLKKRR